MQNNIPFVVLECSHLSLVTKHAYPASTCDDGYTGDVYCGICGSLITKGEKIPATGHLYEKKVINEATCSGGGLIEYVCSVCGDSYTEKIDTIPHSFVTEKVEPTCISSGYTKHTCSVCGYTYKSDYTDISDHTYKAETVREATCTSEGLVRYTCSVCGDSYTEKTAKTDHQMIDEVVKPTCRSKGYTKHTCSVCGYTYKSDYTDISDHTYKVETVREATCTSEGLVRYTCSVCGDSYTEKTAKTDHQMIDEVVKSTCQSKGYTKHTCSVCGYTYKSDYTDISDHTYKAETVREATCTSEGLVRYTCSVCGDSYTEKINMLEHKMETEIILPTCQKTGCTKHTCSECGYSYISDNTDVIAHTYEQEVVKEASCTSEGIVKYICSVCGDVKTIYVDKTRHDFGDNEKQCKICGLQNPNYVIKNTETTTELITTEKNNVGIKDPHGTIIQAPKSLKTVNVKGRKVKISWKKANNVSGYEVIYATNKKITKNKKRKLIKKSSAKNATISKLKKGKTYYFKVRAYTTIDGKKVYGKYTKAKKVKIKK